MFRIPEFYYVPPVVLFHISDRIREHRGIHLGPLFRDVFRRYIHPRHESVWEQAGRFMHMLLLTWVSPELAQSSW